MITSSLAIITTIIIVFTCLVSLLAFYNTEVMSRLIFNPYTIKRSKGEWVRFITSGFIHADYIHLGLNMYVLWSFGGAVEHYYGQLFDSRGKLFFIILYVSALVMSSLSSYFKHRDNPDYNALGASGAVSALVFAFIFISPQAELRLFGGIPINGVIFGILYLIYSSYMAKRGTDNIGHEAHFYGAVFGFFFTGLCKPELFRAFMDKLPGIFGGS